MASQKALYLVEKQGSFAIRERDIPTPAAGDLLVKIKAVALNPLDWKVQATGMFVDTYPAILGLDIAGDVEQVGEGVEGFGIGDRVVFQGRYENDYAGFQLFTKASAEFTAKACRFVFDGIVIPEATTYSQAASVPSGLVTAAIGLFAEAPAGAALITSLDDSIKFTNQGALVIGGSSSVGQYGKLGLSMLDELTQSSRLPAIQLLKWSGFSPIVAYASGHHTDHLKGIGATHVIDRKTVHLQDLPDTVKKVTDARVEIGFDAIGIPDTQEAGYASVADGGSFCTVLPIPFKGVVESKAVYYISSLGTDRMFLRSLFSKIEGMLESGTVMPNNVEELPGGLEGVLEGLERLKKDQVSGKKLIALVQEK
ncbi:hypothetical protein V5O48_005471 [Marasmius crinis-equi]|uniref:Enoyl reductase (ER) domain-containing protein n=1 Tax=Marasmius crinis-equi TaxID=585013 RepID=A0ABR3FM67_9AGAR